MPGLPTGTVTFLFTDIEGSTRLVQQLGDRYAQVLAEYRRLLHTTIESLRGHEINTWGDACFVVFPRAQDAVTTAISIQHALAAHSWPGGTALRVRMGLHTGQPLATATETGYVGLEVHRAARICAAGHGGQILLSQATRDLMAKTLPAGIGLLDLGEHRLKDLPHSDHIFQIVAPGLPADFPAIKVVPNNLPLQLTSFVGRQHDISEVRRLLTTTRLLTLTGAGGVGKTRLALRVAAEALEEFRDGVWLVELAALSDPSLIPNVVASALGVSEQPGRVLTETLTVALGGKSALVILDNCEHLVAACAHLANALLRACPNLIILATSREALGVMGETTWHVPSLAFPDPQRLLPLDRFREYEAVQLFIDRAVANAPQFALTSSNAPAVAQVCRRLDGMPLALELAAARVKAMAVEQIAARLDNRFRLLAGGSRTALPRHQTLRATMDWSYNLLSEPEQVVLRRLSVFAGGFTVEQAEAVCAGDTVGAADVLGLLLNLVDKSMVLVEDREGHVRYRLLDTVQQYGRDRLGESQEAAGVRGRHRAWYLDLAERADPELRGPRQRAWLDRLGTEHDNLRAALEWSKKDAAGAEAGLRLAAALWQFWDIRGHFTEGRRWLDGALARSSEVPPSALPYAFFAATVLSWRQGDYERAATLSQKGLALGRQLEDSEGIARGLLGLGLVEMGRDDRRAAARLEEALILFRELGDHWWIAIVLAQLASTTRRQGDCERAKAFAEESLALFKETGDTWAIAYTLRSLGHVAVAQDDYGRAAMLYTDSLILLREVGEVRDQWVTGECLAGLAGAASAHGNHERAARLYGAAEALWEVLGFRRSMLDRADLDRRVTSIRTKLGDAVFQVAWLEGRAMTPEQAIEYALGAETD